MPQALAWVIPAIIGGVGTGVSLYEGHQQSDQAQSLMKQQQQAAQDAQKKQEQQALLSRQQAFRQLGPDVQSQVGGSLTPESFSAIVAALAGDPGRTGEATSTLFPSTSGPGVSGGPGLTLPGQQPGLTEAMTHLFGGDTEGAFSFAT
jgi:hypothetical protein